MVSFTNHMCEWNSERLHTQHVGNIIDLYHSNGKVCTHGAVSDSELSPEDSEK